MGPAAAAPATSVMNSRRLMCSPWSEGSHAITSLEGMPRCRGGCVRSSPFQRLPYRVRLPALTLRALTLCLETSFRHAVDLGRRFRLPIRRLPALILELLTIRLVTLQQFATLQVLKARGLLRRDFVEPDRHEDAE